MLCQAKNPTKCSAALKLHSEHSAVRQLQLKSAKDVETQNSKKRLTMRSCAYIRAEVYECVCALASQ